jgi:hypothetical protein
MGSGGRYLKWEVEVGMRRGGEWRFKGGYNLGYNLDLLAVDHRGELSAPRYNHCRRTFRSAHP